MPQTKKPQVIQSAWDMFSKGNLAGAEQAAMLAMQQLNDTSIPPIPDIMILKAFYLCRLRKFEDARKLFGRIMEDLPDDGYAQEGYLLALHDKLIGSTPAYIEKSKQKQNDSPSEKQRGTLLIGMGTGRSGSTTLAKLLGNQKNCYCSHEHPPRLAWSSDDRSRLEFHKRRLNELLKTYDFACDVAHWWLPHTEDLIDSYEKIRIVVLKRRRDATINSFLKIKGGTGKGAINHWINHDGTYWTKNIWDECYPDFDASNIQDALGLYWDNYHATVDSLVQRFPSTIRVFETERLGEAETQTEILAFCGFDTPSLETELHLNKGAATDGIRMY